VGDLQSENNILKKQLESVTKTLAKALQVQLTPQLEAHNHIQFLATQVPLDANGMKDLAFGLGEEHNNLFLVLGTVQNNKPMLACYISKELVASSDLNAGNVVRELGKYIQGGGGGQPFFATAGGKNVAGLKEALLMAKKYTEN